MAGFEKVKLATGEFRGEYIARRLGEGATAKAITAEINAVDLYSGAAGKSWPESVVYAEKRKLDAKKEPKAAKSVSAADKEAEADVDMGDIEVPPEYEDILTPADIAEVRKEAAGQVKAEQRKEARKDMLKRARAELHREAARLAQEGGPKGDMIDVLIDLAPAVRVGNVNLPPAIVLDGKHYIHGTTHRVPRRVAVVLHEQMQRAWNHDAGLHGANENAYRQPRMQTVTRAGGAPAGSLRG